MNFCLHGSARTVREAVERAMRAEQLGFEAIFFADSHMNNVDPYQAMAMCAVKTKKIRFGTAVTNMVYRDPTITANSFATLNEISEGRAIIGLGTGDGPVYSLGRTATKLDRLREGSDYDSRPAARPRHRRAGQQGTLGRKRQAQGRSAPRAHLYFRGGPENPCASPAAPATASFSAPASKSRDRVGAPTHRRRREVGRPAPGGNRHHARRHDRR